MSQLKAICIISLVSLLAACGQTGSLYLPDQEQHSTEETHVPATDDQEQ